MRDERGMPISSANLSRLDIGSEPGESMNTRGEQQFESVYVSARSNGGGSMYF